MGFRCEPCIAVGLALLGVGSWVSPGDHIFSTSDMLWVLHNHKSLGTGY